jgi:hypothetical protein
LIRRLRDEFQVRRELFEELAIDGRRLLKQDIAANRGETNFSAYWIID